MPARQCGKPFVEVVINDLLGLGTHLRKHKATGNWSNLLDKRASQAEDKEPTCHAGDRRDVGSVLGPGRSPGGGHGNPL